MYTRTFTCSMGFTTPCVYQCLVEVWLTIMGHVTCTLQLPGEFITELLLQCMYNYKTVHVHTACVHDIMVTFVALKSIA